MSVEFGWQDEPVEGLSKSAVYVYGSEEQGFTKVTYGTSSGTEYEYTPPINTHTWVSVPVEGDVFPKLDPNRPMDVENDVEF